MPRKKAPPGPWSIEYSPIDPESFETPCAVVFDANGVALADADETIWLVELPRSALDLLIAARAERKAK